MVGASTILIVEDSAVQAELLRRTIKAAGYATLIARSGAEGLAAATAAHPAAVISDIAMPGMDGYEMCKRLRQDPTLRAMPVILLTKLSESTDVIRGINAGASYYVTKPYDGHYLLSRLKALLAEPFTGDDATIRTTVEIEGQHYEVNADARRLLTLLISTYSNSVLQYRELASIKRVAAWRIGTAIGAG